MQYVLTAEQMREVDRKTVERFGIPSIVLMENAAQAAVRIIIERLAENSVRANSILLLCGKGNNGGDGAAIARLLAMAGANVDVFLFGEIEDTVGDARTNFEICKRLNDAEYRDDVVYWQPMRWTYRNEGGGINFIEITDKETFYEMLSEGWELGWVALVDAICGTGLNGELRGMVGEITEQLSKWDKYQIKGLGDCLPIFSIDMPSGLRLDRRRCRRPAPSGFGHHHIYCAQTRSSTAARLECDRRVDRCRYRIAIGTVGESGSEPFLQMNQMPLNGSKNANFRAIRTKTNAATHC